MKDRSIRWQACFCRLPGHAALGKQHSVGGGGPEANASFEGEVVHVQQGVNTIEMEELNALFARLL